MTLPLAEVQHHHADLGDVQLHYVTMGEGEPVVLLHGWPQSWYAWRYVMPELAKTRRVIAPDLRGLGDSSRPLEGYDKKTIAHDVWRLLHDHLGLDEFCLVGHDWGGKTNLSADPAVKAASIEVGVQKKVVTLKGTVDTAGIKEQALALARKFASGPTRGLAATKSLIRESSLHSLDDELDRERDMMRELGFSDDYREGVAAFLAKRAPVFTGR